MSYLSIYGNIIQYPGGTDRKAVRTQPGHPYRELNWKRIWDLDMRETAGNLVPVLSGWRKDNQVPENFFLNRL